MDKIYLLYGESIKEIISKRKEIIEEASIGDFNVSIFDMERKTIEEAMEDAYTIPFLEDYRAIVLTNSIFLSTTKEKLDDDVDVIIKRDMTPLLSFINNPVDTTVLIIECPKSNLDNSNPVIKELKNKKYDHPFPLPTKEKIAKYVDDVLKKHNHSIDSFAREELLNRIKDDQLGYQNEIDKLLLYLEPNEPINLKLIKTLISETENESIYSLMNALSNGDKKRALEVYYNLVDQGFIDLQILSSLVKRFSQLLYAKEILLARGTKEDIEETLGVSSGQAFYIMKEAKQLDYNKLSKSLNDLKELDYSTKVDYKYGKNSAIGFELFLLKQ